MEYHYILLAVFLFIQESKSQLSENKEELLNWCLKSKNHKYKPGKEDSLHQQCKPWKEHACCTESVTYDIHHLDMYNFTLDHCFNQVKKNVSSECRKHFTQDNCFYECEPNIGFWVVNTTRKIASERFYKVPLCASDCETWFEACKDDFTCAYNWAQDFKFSKGRNACNEDSSCVTFKDMYHTAKDFCENVWDHSWHYVEDDEPCMHIWFEGTSRDINRKTAEFYIDRQFGTSKASSVSFGTLASVVVATISWKIKILH